VVKFSFDLNENFFVGSLGCQKQRKFFVEFKNNGKIRFLSEAKVSGQ
jgi:hypothetical protein